MKECNCGNYKPYIETMEVGVIHAPAMPFNACVNCYGESMKETLPRPCEHGRLKRQCNECDLQAQNDELMANNERLKTALNLTLVSACNDYSCTEDFHDSMYEVLHEAPAQSLADIRAKAAQDEIDRLAAIIGREFGEKTEGFLKLYKLKLEKDHANRIKEGEL